MKSYLVCFMLSVVLCAGGCASDNGSDGPTWRIVGYSGEATRINDVPATYTITDPVTITTNGFVIIDSEGLVDGSFLKYTDFDAILGADSDTGAASAEVPVNNGIEVTQGWLFLWGQWPSGATPWVRPAPPGTTYVVEVDWDATGVEVHRVYYLKKTAIIGDFKVLCGTATSWTLTEGQYIEVLASCSSLGPASIMGSSQEAFIEKIACVAKSVRADVDLPSWITCP